MSSSSLARIRGPHLSPDALSPVPDEGFHYRSWRGIDLGALEPGWLDLARTASTPNAFFEMGFLLPSLSIFDAEGDVRLALLVEQGAVRGLMPLVDRAKYHGRGIPHRASWLHPICSAAPP